VLLAIGPEKAEPTMGRIKELECAGDPLSARFLEETCEKGTILAEALLLDLAEQGFGGRVIDGELSGYRYDRPILGSCCAPLTAPGGMSKARKATFLKRCHVTIQMQLLCQRHEGFFFPEKRAGHLAPYKA